MVYEGESEAQWNKNYISYINLKTTGITMLIITSFLTVTITTSTAKLLPVVPTLLLNQKADFLDSAEPMGQDKVKVISENVLNRIKPFGCF